VGKNKSKGAQENEQHWRQAEKAATLNIYNTKVTIYLQPATISCSYHMPPKSQKRNTMLKPFLK
jgi:hypothetical protein